MLFKDSIKLKEYAYFTEINFASISLTIRQVEEGELVPIIGATLYNSLNTAYTGAANESSLSDPQKKLLDKVRMFIAPYVGYYFVPNVEVLLSDAGARRTETATSKTAYKNQVINFREQKLTEAGKAAESLLRFLEDNKTDYPEWVASPEFKNYRGLFIKSGGEFDYNFKTASPYLNYTAWRYKMLDVEDQYIRPKISEDLFVHLKAVDATAAAGFTDAEKLLLVKIKKAIAYFTVAYALPFHSVRIDAGGITVNSGNTTNNNDQEVRAAAPDNAINQIMKSAESSGTMWLSDATNFILANPLEFPDYEYFPDTTTILPIDFNCDAQGAFGLY